MILRSLKCKALLVALALAALPIGMTSPALAAVVPTFSFSPTSILEGGSATLHLQISLDDPGLEFVGGSVTLFSGLSGLGTSSFFPIAKGGTQDFEATFSYPTAGTYTAFVPC